MAKKAKHKLSKEERAAKKAAIKASLNFKPAFIPQGRIEAGEYVRPTHRIGVALTSPKNARAWYNMVKPNYDRLIASGDYKADSRYMIALAEKLESAHLIFNGK